MAAKKKAKRKSTKKAALPIKESLAILFDGDLLQEIDDYDYLVSELYLLKIATASELIEDIPRKTFQYKMQGLEAMGLVEIYQLPDRTYVYEWAGADDTDSF